MNKDKALGELNTAVFTCFEAGCTMEEVAGEFTHASSQAEADQEEKREQEQWEKDHEGKNNG